ncbi:MAG: preprotein translocase subunit SecG [Candidatus Gracilibacteria bacterium]|nr:preprotein translocase subunit SecG [Candidatus Gracilibacteria bacterium]
MLETLKFTMIIVSILLVFIILIQNKNVSLNLSSMSGGMGEVTKRGPEKILDTTTKILGTIFIIHALALFILS